MCIKQKANIFLTKNLFDLKLQNLKNQIFFKPKMINKHYQTKNININIEQKDW